MKNQGISYGHMYCLALHIDHKLIKGIQCDLQLSFILNSAWYIDEVTFELDLKDRDFKGGLLGKGGRAFQVEGL